MGLETNKVNYKESWNLIRLKELCSRISDGTHFTPEYVNEGIPFISVKDIYDEKVNFNKCKFITIEAHQELIKRCFPEKDDVLITKSGTIGRMALVPEKPEFSLFVSVALLKNKKELIHSKFLKYCLENFLNHINIAQDIKGGLLKNFHLEDIRETVIPQVTLEEQQAIVSKIEELLSDLDNGKQQLKLAQQQLKVYRQSLLKWAFEGKLTNKNVKDSELPKGWKVVDLKEVVDKISDGPFGSNLKSIDYINDGIRVIRLENIGEMEFRNEYKTFVSLEKYETIKNHTVGKGDIIFSSFISESIRSVILPDYIEKAINKADCFLVRVSDTKINKKYLSYYFSTKSMRNQLVDQIHGATRPRINTTQLKTALIPFAPLKEQQLIVDELESKLTVCDKIEETISQSLQQAESLRHSILKKAFEGKLV